MLKNFRSYQLAVSFYQICAKIRRDDLLHEQLLRASSSAVLNLAEGSERVTDRDRRKFYRIAMGSVRECQAILDLIQDDPMISSAKAAADSLGASVFKLCSSLDKTLTPQNRT